MSKLRRFIERIQISSVLRLIFLLNIIDALLTAVWIRSGIANEANPVMSYLISQGIATFVITKVLCVLVAVTILWNFRALFFARVVSIFALVVMMAVIIYHAVGIHLVANP